MPSLFEMKVISQEVDLHCVVAPLEQVEIPLIVDSDSLDPIHLDGQIVVFSCFLVGCT